jgi:hypothetical protein
VSAEKDKGMPRDEFLNTTLHMLHVAACSAQSTAQMIYGARAAVPFTRIAQILNAMRTEQYEDAAEQLRKFAEGT